MGRREHCRAACLQIKEFPAVDGRADNFESWLIIVGHEDIVPIIPNRFVPVGSSGRIYELPWLNGQVAFEKGHIATEDGLPVSVTHYTPWNAASNSHRIHGVRGKRSNSHLLGAKHQVAESESIAGQA